MNGKPAVIIRIDENTTADACGGQYFALVVELDPESHRRSVIWKSRLCIQPPKHHNTFDGVELSDPVGDLQGRGKLDLVYRKRCRFAKNRQKALGYFCARNLDDRNPSRDLDHELDELRKLAGVDIRE
jgi:hypothetical protein